MSTISNFKDLATQQILKEQLDNRVQELDDWMNQSDIAWKEQHILLPYPKYPGYPSADKVLARAKLLYQIHEDTNSKKEQKEQNEQVKIEPPESKVEPVVEQLKEEDEIIKINTGSEKESIQNTKEIKVESIQEILPPGFNYRRKK